MTVDIGIWMKQKELTKTFLFYDNFKLVSMVLLLDKNLYLRFLYISRFSIYIFCFWNTHSNHGRQHDRRDSKAL